MPMDTTLVYRKFVLLNIKLLSVNMSLRYVVVIGVSCFIAEVFRKDMTAVRVGMFVYKDFTSMVTNMAFCGRCLGYCFYFVNHLNDFTNGSK